MVAHSLVSARKKVQTLAAFAAFSVGLSGCGGAVGFSNSLPSSDPAASLPQIDVPGEDGIIIKSRATITINPDSPTFASRFFQSIIPSATAGSSGQQSININNGVNTSMTIDATQWQVPGVSNTMLSFGSLGISVADNNLKICGDKQNSQCTHAYIRIYTTGPQGTGAGLWNSADSYGMPITAAIQNTNTSQTVTLSPTPIQSAVLDGGTHSLTQAVFGSNTRYLVSSDFTNAGAGSYSATLVIEYAVSL